MSSAQLAAVRTIASTHSGRRRAATASVTFRVLAKATSTSDAALAPAVGCPPPPRSLTPPRRPLSNQRVVVHEGAALPRLSGRGSPPDGSLVAALLTEQKSADQRGAPLRFAPGTSLARTHSSGCHFRFATSGGLRRRDGSPIRCESHASRDTIGPAAPWKRTRGPDRDYCTREATGPMLAGS